VVLAKEFKPSADGIMIYFGVTVSLFSNTFRP
jgi:hypothetical protein